MIWTRSIQQRLDDAGDKLPWAWELIVPHMGNAPVSLNQVTPGALFPGLSNHTSLRMSQHGLTGRNSFSVAFPVLPL